MQRAPVLIFTLILVGFGLVAALFLLRGSGDDEPVAATTAPPPETTAAPSPASTAGDTTAPPTTAPVVGDLPAAYVPSFEEGPCRFTVPDGTSPLCGWLTVPENRAVADGGDVRLHVAVFESPDPVAPHPIVYLDGGPGGESLDPLQYSFDEVWAPFLAHGDLVFFDQRGVGHSEPSLTCPETLELSFDLLDEDLPTEESLRRELDALGECRSRLQRDGVDLTAYDSAANAADVADLRIALGYEEWNLLGISYGTRLAQTVMRDHPEGVRSVILDSTYPIEANIVTESPANLDRAFDVLFSACEEDTDCAVAYPELRRRLFALVDAFDTDPLPYRARNFLTGEGYDVLLTGTGLLGTVRQGLYSDEIFPQIPEMIAELEQGETTILSLLTSNDLAQAEFFSFGMHLSVQCREEVPFTDPTDIDAGIAEYPELAELFDETFNVSDPVFALCELWDAGASGPIENEPVTAAIPTLVMAGAYDPVTPPRWGRDVAAHLPDAHYVEFPTLAHGASVAGECPVAIALAFFAAPDTAPDTSCIGGMDPVPFVVAPFDPAAITLVPFEEVIFGITVSGLAPDDWESLDNGAWARGASGIDQTVIVQQAVPALGLTEEVVVDLYAQQLGIEDGFTYARDVDSPGGTWSLYSGSLESFIVDVAVREGESVVALVVLVSEQDERDDLVRAVLLPALAAYEAS